MSLISNLISVGLAHLSNNRRNHLSTRVIDFISTGRTLVLCGGKKGEYNRRGEYVMSLAEENKLETFFAAAEEAQRKNQGAVCFYAVDNFLKPDINQIRLRTEFIRFGENAAYSPLVTSDNNIQRVYSFFERIVQRYCQRNHKENYSTICGVISMLLHIIDESMGSEYLTLDNIRLLADALSVDNVMEFQSNVEKLTRKAFLRDWDNYLVLSWDDSVRQFHEFWKSFCLSISHYGGNQERKESLHTVIMDKKVCFCPIGTEDAFLKDIMLSEMEMIYGNTCSYKLIDYYVPLDDVENYRCITDGLCSFIGDSLRSMGIKNCYFTDIAVICLGVNASDAKDILEIMVASGSWIQTYFGFGPSGVHFNSIEKRPVAERDLSLQQIRDGSAYRLDSRGFTKILNLFS